MKRLIFVSLVLLVAFLAVPSAVATVNVGNFQAQLYDPETMPTSDPLLNDGYNNGTWYKYPQEPHSPPPPPFWNEWWYDDPYQLGGKRVQITFDYQLINKQAPGDVHVTINWTNAGWVGQTAPPTWENSPDPEVYIGRLAGWDFHLVPDLQNPLVHWTTGWFDLPIDYNPEWVSVDVQGGINVGISNGVLLHECVPEPATMALLGLGALAMLRKHKK